MAGLTIPGDVARRWAASFEEPRLLWTKSNMADFLLFIDDDDDVVFDNMMIAIVMN